MNKNFNFLYNKLKNQGDEIRAKPLQYFYRLDCLFNTRKHIYKSSIIYHNYR